MADLKCPHCRRDFVRRVSRNGIAERLLSLLYVYPFKCQLCGWRFRALQWGVRYVRVKEDRREYDRMEMGFPVSFDAPEVAGEGEMLNLSMGGCSFSTAAAVPVGAILRMRLNITPSIDPVRIEAAVVRSAGPGRAGVEFLRWPEGERERLQLFVRGMLIGRPESSEAGR